MARRTKTLVLVVVAATLLLCVLEPADAIDAMPYAECLPCLKECLGAKLTAAQQATLRLQAPFSLLTWYLFRNKPFSMWPAEEALHSLASVNPSVYGTAAAVAYLSCARDCDEECPDPRRRKPTEPVMDELKAVNLKDLSPLMKLYHGTGARAGSQSKLGQTLGAIFRM